MFVIALAMMVFAVEGYAQREKNGRGSDRSTTRTIVNSRSSLNTRERSDFHNNNRSSVREPTVTRRDQSGRSVTDSRKNHQRREGNIGAKSVRPSNKPRHHSNQSHYHQFGHNHSHRTHRCVFEVWYWVNYFNYSNRFICHGYYPDRYFDTMLGYYVQGSLNNPQKIVVGDVTFYRYNNHLGVYDGAYKSYSLSCPQNIVYNIGYTTVDIDINDGRAKIQISDDYDNYAIYYL